MNKFKTALILFLSLLCAGAALAELPGAQRPESWVKELSSQRINECQTALFDPSDQDQYPVILIYSSTGPGKELSDIFMPTYEKVAALMHNKRSFFKYDAGAVDADYSVIKECLGLSGGIAVPTVNVVTKDEEAVAITNPLRAIGGLKLDPKEGVVSIRPVELISAITMPFPTGTAKTAATQVIIKGKKH